MEPSRAGTVYHSGGNGRRRPPSRSGRNVWLYTAITRKVVDRFTYFLHGRICNSILDRYVKFDVNIIIMAWVIGDKQVELAKSAPSTARATLHYLLLYHPKLSLAHSNFLSTCALRVVEDNI